MRKRAFSKHSEVVIKIKSQIETKPPPEVLHFHPAVKKEKQYQQEKFLRRPKFIHQFPNSERKDDSYLIERFNQNHQESASNEVNIQKSNQRNPEENQTSKDSPHHSSLVYREMAKKVKPSEKFENDQNDIDEIHTNKQYKQPCQIKRNLPRLSPLKKEQTSKSPSPPKQSQIRYLRTHPKKILFRSIF